MGVVSARAAGDGVELRPEDTRWLRFVAGASEASAFHEPGWLAALTASYGYQSLVLALMAPGGEVIAGLPLSRTRRPLSGVAYVSLPFTDDCPPLARNEDALLLLAQGLERWRRSVGISAIEIRGPLGTGSLAADAVGAEEVPLISTHSGTPGAGLRGNRRLTGALRVVIGYSPLSFAEPLASCSIGTLREERVRP